MTSPYIYEFGTFKFDPVERSVTRDGIPVLLTEKAFQVLEVLVSQSGHLVTRSELVNAVWGDAFVEEGNLTVTISMLRKALGDDRGKNKFIETIAKHGYRFLPQVTCVPREASSFRESSNEPKRPNHDEVLLTQPIVATRLQRTYVGGVALFLTTLVVFVVTIKLHSKPTPVTDSHVERYVAVAPFNVAGPDNTDRKIGGTIATDLVGRLRAGIGLQAQSVGELREHQQTNNVPNSVKGGQEVDALLTGLVEAAQGQAHIIAKLSGSNGETLWSDNYTVPVEKIEQVESQIESRVRERMLSLSLSSQPSRSSHDSEAQRLYIVGRYFWNERTEIGLRRSIECFQQAIFRDPNFSEAYAGLASSYALLGSYSVESPAEAYPNAKSAAQRALQLNGDLAEGHTALGMVALYYEWNWQSAEQEFSKAINLAPDYSGVYTWNSLYFAAVGETSHALQQALKAQQMDPLSMAAIMHVGSAYYWDRQYTKAAETYRYALAQDSTFARAHSRLGIVLAAQKKYAEAIQEFRETERLSGPDPYTDGLIGYAEALRENPKGARKILDELTARSQHEYIPAFSLALLHLGLGDHEKALDWLNRAFQDRSTYLVYAKVDPLLDPLRSDRRFELLLGDMALQPHNLQTATSRKPEIAESSMARYHRPDFRLTGME